MIREFEGRTEQEAIDIAVEALNLNREDFDVEIIGGEKKGLFKKGSVKIRIHIDDNEFEVVEEDGLSADGGISLDDEPYDEFEEQTIDFLANIIERMGYEATIYVAFRTSDKVGLTIESASSGILIGKKGKNLDALQLIVNVYAGQLEHAKKVVVDSENYRVRHEEQIIKLAYRTAAQVKRSKRSRLLEPMNPFERRLIHTALNDMVEVETRSEGEGLYKQVRIIYKGSNQ